MWYQKVIDTDFENREWASENETVLKPSSAPYTTPVVKGGEILDKTFAVFTKSERTFHSKLDNCPETIQNLGLV